MFTASQLRARSLAKRLYSLQHDIAECENSAVALSLSAAVVNLTKTIKSEGLAAEVHAEMTRIKNEVRQALELYGITSK